MPKYQVRFEIDVDASSPTLAATAARDILLDPETEMLADVYPYEWVEAADEWFPAQDPGWCADFRFGGVRPDVCFAVKVVRYGT